MLFKRFLAISLSFVLSFSVLAYNTYAGESVESYSYTWDEPNVVYEPIQENKVITTRGLPMEVFVRYDQTLAKVVDRGQFVGELTCNNSGNLYSGMEMTFKASNSGSWDVSSAISFTGKGEAGAILAKVEAGVSIGATVKRSWSKGEEYGASTMIPPGKIGTMKAYIKGISTKGSLVYRIYNTSNDSYREYTKAVGATIPSRSSWNIDLFVK